jgi:hypothetical protein
MHGVRGFFRYAHIDGTIASDPAVYARLPKVDRDESRTQGLDRLELIRFLQVAQTLTVHHGALASCSASAPCVHPRQRQCGSRTTPRPCEATGCCTWSARATTRNHALDRPRATGSGSLPRRTHLRTPDLATADWQADRSTRRLPDGAAHRELPASLATSAPTRCATPPSPTPSTLVSHSATPRFSRATPTPGPPSTTTAPAATSTDTASTSSPHTSPESERRSLTR